MGVYSGSGYSPEESGNCRFRAECKDDDPYSISDVLLQIQLKDLISFIKIELGTSLEQTCCIDSMCYLLSKILDQISIKLKINWSNLSETSDRDRVANMASENNARKRRDLIHFSYPEGICIKNAIASAVF